MKYKILKKQNNSAMCFVCGTQNEKGLKARFYECEREDSEKVLLTVIEPKPESGDGDITHMGITEEHQSYPNRMHGGVTAALLDEGVGRALWLTVPDVWGVTIDLNVKYRKPVPLDQKLYIESKITAVTSRSFDGEGKLFLVDGTVCATCNGKYFIAPVEKIAGGLLDHTNWYYVDEELPDEIIV